MKKEEKKYILSQLDKVDDIGEISDGYHTFNSLYNQRLCLWAALVNAYKDKAWKSRLHHDGEPCFGGGWFIVGITTPAGDYTYHYELKDWNLFDCKVLDKAPEWDGHTDNDVSRVLTLNKTITGKTEFTKCVDLFVDTMNEQFFKTPSKRTLLVISCDQDLDFDNPDLDKAILVKCILGDYDRNRWATGFAMSIDRTIYNMLNGVVADVQNMVARGELDDPNYIH